jgi:hypothetical protein
MAKEIKTLDDLQSELQTLKSLAGVIFWMVRELPYPTDEGHRRNQDELTAVAQVVFERLVDLDTAVADSYLALREGDRK